MFDFNSMLPDTAKEEFEQGYVIAAVAVLEVEQKIRKAFPNRSPAFYRGVIDGLRQEI